MTTKLISMNVGVQLELLVDGKERKIGLSAVSGYGRNTVEEILDSICNLLNSEFGTSFEAFDPSPYPVKIEIYKPKRIKAPKRVSHAEFNKRIKELQP